MDYLRNPWLKMVQPGGLRQVDEGADLFGCYLIRVMHENNSHRYRDKAYFQAMALLLEYRPSYQAGDGEPRRERRHGDGDWPVSLAMHRQAGTAVSHADYTYDRALRRFIALFSSDVRIERSIDKLCFRGCGAEKL